MITVKYKFMENVFGFIFAMIFLYVGFYIFKNPNSEANSYSQKADQFSKEYRWIPLVGTIYKNNAKFYKSKYGIWFLRFWGIVAMVLSTLILYSIFTQNFL